MMRVSCVNNDYNLLCKKFVRTMVCHKSNFFQRSSATNFSSWSLWSIKWMDGWWLVPPFFNTMNAWSFHLVEEKTSQRKIGKISNITMLLDCFPSHMLLLRSSPWNMFFRHNVLLVRRPSFPLLFSFFSAHNSVRTYE